MKISTKLFRVVTLLIVALSIFLPSSSAFAEGREIEVYLGGDPLGIELAGEGVIVTELLDVVTDDGIVSPSRNAGLRVDDVILEVDGYRVKTVKDVKIALIKAKDLNVELRVKRVNDTFYTCVSAVIDSVTREKRLGISISEGISGIGTLTFVTKDGYFGGLGHMITDEYGRTPSCYGKIYKCSIFEVKKGLKGNPGELQGVFSNATEHLGEISKNNAFGVYGRYCGDVKGYKSIKIGRKEDVKNGRAYIYSTVEGDEPRRYEVEIEKICEQTYPEQKGLLIRVVDKRLLNATGGIVRGMSGSPIVQDGKLVGAVTHVLINNPTKGYGVFAEWMLENAG